jgi:L,D-transpeptidase catalytic domain
MPPAARPWPAVLTLAAALAVVRPAMASPPLRELSATGPLGNERLSNERTLSRWASPIDRAAIRRRAATDGRRVGRLRLLTEDGYPEVYLALRSRTRADGHVWLKIRIPARPNGQTGWVRRSALGPLHAVTTLLVIDRRRSRAMLRRSGRRIWRAPIGHGAPGTPTPAGRFYIREKLRNAGGSPIYGPWAFGTSAYSSLSDWPGGGVIGIHGTNQPWLIPGRPSHGCIRVRNAAVVRLARLLPIGTPVKIR